MVIYQISGLGANEKAFSYLNINPSFKIVYLPWLLPEKNESIFHYSQRMSDKINPNEDFILMGLSFGGIIAQEINRYLQPKHNFLISTVKNKNELPQFMRLASKVNAHKILPINFLASDSMISYTVFRQLYYTKKNTDISEIFEFKDKEYLKWSIHNIVNWESHFPITNYTHIHGNNDVVFPSKNIKNTELIEGGTHIMVMQKHKAVSELINNKLKQL